MDVTHQVIISQYLSVVVIDFDTCLCKWLVDTNTLLSTKKEAIHLKLDDSVIPQEDIPTFLGVRLDTRLTQRPHIDATRARAIRRLALMNKLPGTSWGANAAVLKQVYTGYDRPHGHNHMVHVSHQQNQTRQLGKRMMLGTMRTTPIADMEKNVRNRRNTKILIQSEKAFNLNL